MSYPKITEDTKKQEASAPPLVSAKSQKENDLTQIIALVFLDAIVITLLFFDANLFNRIFQVITIAAISLLLIKLLIKNVYKYLKNRFAWYDSYTDTYIWHMDDIACFLGSIITLICLTFLIVFFSVSIVQINKLDNARYFGECKYIGVELLEKNGKFLGQATFEIEIFQFDKTKNITTIVLHIYENSPDSPVYTENYKDQAKFIIEIRNIWHEAAITQDYFSNCEIDPNNHNNFLLCKYNKDDSDDCIRSNDEIDGYIVGLISSSVIWSLLWVPIYLVRM